MTLFRNGTLVLGIQFKQFFLVLLYMSFGLSEKILIYYFRLFMIFLLFSSRSPCSNELFFFFFFFLFLLTIFVVSSRANLVFIPLNILLQVFCFVVFLLLILHMIVYANLSREQMKRKTSCKISASRFLLCI